MSNDTSCFIGRSVQGRMHPFASTPSTGTFRVTLGENPHSLVAYVESRVKVSVKHVPAGFAPVRPFGQTELILHVPALRAVARKDFLVSSDHAYVHTGSLHPCSLTGGLPGHLRVSPKHRLYHSLRFQRESTSGRLALLPCGIVVEPSRIGVSLHTELGC